MDIVLVIIDLVLTFAFVVFFALVANDMRKRKQTGFMIFALVLFFVILMSLGADIHYITTELL